MDGPVTALQTFDCASSVHISYRGEFLIEQKQNFQGITLTAFIITFVKCHLKLLSAKFLLDPNDSLEMNSQMAETGRRGPMLVCMSRN